MAWSSCEAEFVAACAAAKIAMYLRSILDEINVPQHHTTMIYEDNTGALTMANTGQPTKRTKHMDTKHFALQDWVEQDLVNLEQINSPDNSADSFTKALARTKFYVHNDVIMGRMPPKYYNGDITPIVLEKPSPANTNDTNALVLKNIKTTSKRTHNKNIPTMKPTVSTE